MKLQSKLDYMRPILPRDGLLQISGVVKILENNLKAKTFEELMLPLVVCATDLNHGKSEYISNGELITAVIASSSIPAEKSDKVISQFSGILSELIFQSNPLPHPISSTFAFLILPIMSNTHRGHEY